MSDIVANRNSRIIPVSRRILKNVCVCGTVCVRVCVCDGYRRPTLFGLVYPTICLSIN